MTRVMARVNTAPVVLHAAGLLLVLLALMPFMETDAAFSPDEGAAIIQARALADRGTWIVDHPFPEADPDRVLYPLTHGLEGKKGVAPLGRHAGYSFVIAAASKVAGVTGMFLVSVFAVVVAALVGGRVARRFDPRVERTAIWAIGLGTPLLFDAYLVMGHALAAGLCTGAFLLGLKSANDSRPRIAVALLTLSIAAALIRQESVFLIGALGAGLMLSGLLRRDWRVLTVGAATGMAAGGARLFESRIHGWIAGSSSAGIDSPASDFFRGRFDAMHTTWFRGSFVGGGHEVLLLLAALLLCCLTASLVRRQSANAAAVFAVAAAGFAVARHVVAGADVVTGLFAATPVLAAGLVAFNWRLDENDDSRIVAVTLGLFALAVLATQYAEGGGAEWGGRFFAVGVPIAAAIGVVGLADVLRRLPVRPRQVVALCLIVVTASLSIMAVRGMRRYRGAVDDVIAATSRAAGDGYPVIVTSSSVASRLAWPHFFSERWLLYTDHQARDLGPQLRSLGVERLTVVVAGGQHDLIDTLPGFHAVHEEHTGRGFGAWRVFAMQAD